MANIKNSQSGEKASGRQSKAYYSIGEAAKMVGTTSETLRHYDRIGLVTPAMKDPWTQYRYYTQQDIVRLYTVRALQRMDLPLKQIQRVLSYDDLETIISFLREAEARAEEKMAMLRDSKAQIRQARAQYEATLAQAQPAQEAVVKRFPQRVILLSDSLEQPTLDVLWNYLRHFYQALPLEQRERFDFEDQAGIYTRRGRSRLFALCRRYEEREGLIRLPPGDYLVADCDEAARSSTLGALTEVARTRYHTQPDFILEQIVVSGILQWRYQVQLYIGPAAGRPMKDSRHE